MISELLISGYRDVYCNDIIVIVVVIIIIISRHFANYYGNRYYKDRP